ncbi:MAG: hypothetical protein ABFD89_00970 [Bryobacteraceae bacterium]
MTKEIKGWTALADVANCECKIVLDDGFCCEPQFWTNEEIAKKDICKHERIVPATLTYEVPDDNG